MITNYDQIKKLEERHGIKRTWWDVLCLATFVAAGLCVVAAAEVRDRYEAWRNR
jgi:hypothetical protein